MPKLIRPATTPKSRPVRSIRSESSAAYKISRTLPEEIIRHDISDEELSLLADSRIDYLWEGMWVALGILLGAAPAALPAAKNVLAGDGEVSISGGELVQVIVFSCAVVAFVILGLIMRGKRANVSDLVTRIRKRARRDVPANPSPLRPESRLRPENRLRPGLYRSAKASRATNIGQKG